MRINRRHILALGGSGLLSKLFGATFDVDRLLATPAAASVSAGRVELRKYTANATVMLFSIPLVSRAAVGSGYAVVESEGQMLSLQFGAGSYPENARGLNRLGFIQEAVMEEKAGRAVECAWLAFMTTSQEKSLDQARKALEESGAMVPYSASQGIGQKGCFDSRVDRLEFPSSYTWRNITELVEKARGTMTALTGKEQQAAPGGAEKPATFLYQVRRAILDPQTRTSSLLVFNGKEFELDAVKENDPAAGAHFGRAVIRLSANITEKRTGLRTPFRVWYEEGGDSGLPLRFEYQAKSFLRLTFEADAKAGAPPIRFAFKSSKENA